jgi:probable rRNA maturation factor
MPDLQLNGEPIADEPEPPERSIRVQVANETGAEVDVERIEAGVRAVFAEAPYGSIAVSVALVDDKTIHELNRQFLNHDYSTDVLSFSLTDSPERLEGEIVASLDTARQCATEAGWSTGDELLLYVVHGALHLAGFRDKGRRDAAEMRATEAAILAKLGVALSARDSRWRSEAAPEGESP